jgi:hypothetical protein
VGIQKHQTVNSDQDIQKAMERRERAGRLIQSLWIRFVEASPDPLTKGRVNQLVTETIKRMEASGETISEQVRKDIRRYHEHIARGYKTKAPLHITGCGEYIVLEGALPTAPSFPIKIAVRETLINNVLVKETTERFAGQNPRTLAEIHFAAVNTTTLMPFGLLGSMLFGDNPFKWLDKNTIRSKEVGKRVIIEGKPVRAEGRISITVASNYGYAPINIKMNDRFGRLLDSVQAEEMKKIGSIWLPGKLNYRSTLLKQKSTFQLSSAQVTKSPLSTLILPKGSSVIDWRLGNEKPVSYNYEGKLPNLEELKKLWRWQNSP